MADCIVLKSNEDNPICAIDSICFGEEYIKTLNKGDRIMSGSIIKVIYIYIKLQKLKLKNLKKYYLNFNIIVWVRYSLNRKDNRKIYAS